MEIPSACLMVKTIKISETAQEWELVSFLEDKQTVQIIWFKAVSELAAMCIRLLSQFTGGKSFRGGFQERNLQPSGMWVKNVPHGIATGASVKSVAVL